MRRSASSSSRSATWPSGTPSSAPSATPRSPRLSIRTSMTDIRFTSRSPVFVAHFADGETTRMTVCTTLDKLDVGRGVRLSRHAYSSRTGKAPPAILEACFEAAGGGEILTRYTQDELAKVTP